MEKLPSDFTYDKYGIQARFVTENDAEFIIKLRTDPLLTRFIHDTDSDVQKQREWIRNYKVREAEGKEYYFVVSNNDIPAGLIRIYHIHDKVFTVGSFIMDKGAPMHCALATTIMAKEIAFEILDMELEDSFDGVHVDNKQVVKLSLSWGKKEYRRFQDVKGEYIAFQLTKEDYFKVKPKKVRQLQLLMGEKD
jgi:hypothetical protein